MTRRATRKNVRHGASTRLRGGSASASAQGMSPMHKSAFQYREVLGTVMRTITSRIKTGRIIGAIEVINRQGGTAFDEDDLDILEAFAKAAGKNCVRSSDGG